MGTTTQGVTIPEAARLLGVSESTIRRRIRAGELDAAQIPTSQGYEWRINPDGERARTGYEQVATSGDQVGTNGGQVGTNGERIPTATDQEHSEIRELRQTFLELLSQERERHDRQLREERERGEELQHQVAQASAQVGYWKGRHEEAEAKILALSAPAETREGGDRAQWWRRLLGLQPA